MKLEALNGNLMSLTGKATSQEAQSHNQKADLKLVLDVGEGEEDETEAEEQKNGSDGGDKEPVEATGKKKGTRKKRSLNWEEAERGLLLEALKPKVEFVENRNVDAKSIKAKRLAWMQITKQFNALNFRHRSLEQIQVQWRAMKNVAKREHQQKHPKSATVEGMDMIEFMEEMQKDPTSGRSQTRHLTSAAAAIHKKELLEIDDEDTPLAALPTTSNNASEDTLQTSTIALPSPPPSADSQNDTQQAAPTRNRKKSGVAAASAQNISNVATTHKHRAGPASATTAAKLKRQRIQNSGQSDSATPTATSVDIAVSVGGNTPTPQPLLQHSTLATCTTPLLDDNKYKKQLFELIKSARLAEIDCVRREHEQKLRFDELEHEQKLSYCRQQEELKLRQMREEHELRMRCYQAEHEARMRAYTLGTRKSVNAKYESDNGTNVFK